MTRNRSFAPRKTLLLAGLGGCLALAGCAGAPPPKTPALTPEQVALNQSIEQIAQMAGSLRTASKPYNGFPLPQTSPGKTEQCANIPPNSPLAQHLSAQWSGKASVLLGGLAARWGWSFDNRLGHHHDPDVAVYTHGKTAADILALIAHETPRNVVVSVEPGLITLGVRG